MGTYSAIALVSEPSTGELPVRNIGSDTLRWKLVKTSVVDVRQMQCPREALRGLGRHFLDGIAYADWYVIEFGVSISKVRSPCV